jgi:hypothetical protein
LEERCTLRNPFKRKYTSSKSISDPLLRKDWSLSSENL